MCSIYLISPSIINKTSYIPFFELKNGWRGLWWLAHRNAWRSYFQIWVPLKNMCETDLSSWAASRRVCSLSLYDENRLQRWVQKALQKSTVPEQNLVLEWISSLPVRMKSIEELAVLFQFQVQSLNWILTQARQLNLTILAKRGEMKIPSKIAMNHAPECQVKPHHIEWYGLLLLRREWWIISLYF